MKTILAILNQKGGVGKTTTAINLSAYLAGMGRRVLVCDLDPQGNSTSGLGVDKNSLNTTIYDVLFGRADSNRAIKHLPKSGVFLLPSNGHLAGAEVEMVSLPNREFLLKNQLAKLDYDYIFIDCPPSLGLLTVNALSAANEVIIPVQAEYYALEGLGQLLATYQSVRQSLNPNLGLLGILITLYDSRTVLSDQVRQELQKHFGDRLFQTVIPRSVRLAEAPSFGKTIAEHDNLSRGAQAYQNLAKEVESKLHGQ